MSYYWILFYFIISLDPPVLSWSSLARRTSASTTETIKAAPRGTRWWCPGTNRQMCKEAKSLTFESIRVTKCKPCRRRVCRTNANMKVCEADQRATTCSTNPELKGNIEGAYGSLAYTYTELVGKDNSLLYQVWLTKAALNYYQAVLQSREEGH